MNESNQLTYHGVRFYKCALQVNPFGYAKQHGNSSGATTEEEYNNAMAKSCGDAGVRVVALANHGDVTESERLRKILRDNGIVVFPGFEIASSEKIHMVCFFPADAGTADLNRYLGAISGGHAKAIGKQGTHASALTCIEIAKHVKTFDGVWYAPHMDGRNGLLERGSPEIWRQHEFVRAGSLTKNLREIEDGVRTIVENVTPEYKRERRIAIINANDVSKPPDFTHPRTSCWIKMASPPTIESLRQAFLDPSSRISLNEPKSLTASHIKSVQWSGGGLFRGSEAALSENLNAVIGGRGAGKSSLLESIRYALNRMPVGEKSVKAFDGIVKKNLADSKVTVQVWSREQGAYFKISRRYGEQPRVETDDGQPSNMSIQDILPRIDILGQNEILEISDNPQKVRELLETFLPADSSFVSDTRRIREQLRSNRDQMLKLERDLDDIQQITCEEASLTERLRRLKVGGIEEKLTSLSSISEERRLCEKLDDVEVHLGQWLGEWDSVVDSLPSPPDGWSKWPNGSALADAHRLFSDTLRKFTVSRDSMHKDSEKLKSEFSRMRKSLNDNWGKLQDEINDLANQLPTQDGETGGGAALSRYKKLRAQIDAVERAKESEKKTKHALDKTREYRQALLKEYKNLHFERYNVMRNAAETLNAGKALRGKLRIEITSMGDRKKLKEFIIANVAGVGESGVTWLEEQETIDTVTMAEIIRANDVDRFRRLFSNTAPTKGVASKIIKMSHAASYELEEVVIDDSVVVSLNLAAPGTPDNFCPIGPLSPGQRCTAILSLFLLNRDSPLVLDQPEDHLDNAFIAGYIAEKIRKIKKDCQLILSTHNANIPVFGDAELIAVLETDEQGRTIISNELLGSIEKPAVKAKTAEILDGGREAFTIRREKYGY